MALSFHCHLVALCRGVMVWGLPLSSCSWCGLALIFLFCCSLTLYDDIISQMFFGL